MARMRWRQSRSVKEGLFEEGHRFTFVQAVRLLEQMSFREKSSRTAAAEDAHPDREIARFRHAVRLDFPPGDVERVRPVDGGPAEVTVNVIGLAGALGPLPPPVSELIVERSFRGDTAFRDFLDIFNHRLVWMLYRERKKYRPALDHRGPDRGRVARVLHAFLGLGTPRLLDQTDVADRALLPYAGLLLDRHRSVVGLVRMLEDYFDLRVRVAQFCGEWNVIEPDDRTRIGRSGANQILGRDALLGGRIWDDEAAIEVQLGPLPLDRFLQFVPNGGSYAVLVALTRFYLREELAFSFRLRIAAAEVPSLRIGKDKPAFLGWTTWLATRPFTADDEQVRIRGRA